jgi:hypothetical protein
MTRQPGREEGRSKVERLVLRRVVLLGTPLALAILEIFHPQPGGVGEAVEQGGWFMWFHIIQVPLIGLIALAVYLLTEGLEGRAVMVSRWAIGVFAVFFSAYDAAAGIGTGYALRNAQGLPAGAQEAVHEAVIDMPGLSLIFDSGDRCLGGGADSGGYCATACWRVPRPLHLADLGGGVSDGRASLPGWHFSLRVLLPGHRVARARTRKAHVS